MPENVPSADQIRAYLLANGWQMGKSGKAAYLMVGMGHAIRMLHEPTEYDRDKAVFDISLAEGRHPADAWKDILACAVTAAPDGAVAGDVVVTLTARRIALGLSQRRVGFISGLGTSVCEYEAGRHAPTLPKLIAWADALGCDVTLTVRPAPRVRTHFNGWDDFHQDVRDNAWARRVAAPAKADDMDELRRRLAAAEASAHHATTDDTGAESVVMPPKGAP